MPATCSLCVFETTGWMIIWIALFSVKSWRLEYDKLRWCCLNVQSASLEHQSSRGQGMRDQGGKRIDFERCNFKLSLFLILFPVLMKDHQPETWTVSLATYIAWSHWVNPALSFYFRFPVPTIFASIISPQLFLCKIHLLLLNYCFNKNPGHLVLWSEWSQMNHTIPSGFVKKVMVSWKLLKWPSHFSGAAQ